jgi:hypothetical protein
MHDRLNISTSVFLSVAGHVLKSQFGWQSSNRFKQVFLLCRASLDVTNFEQFHWLLLMNMSKSMSDEPPWQSEQVFERSRGKKTVAGPGSGKVPTRI